MDETAFWSHLEYRVSREFRGMSENHLRWMWCDGFMPEEYLSDEPEPRVTGRAWICQGQHQELWSFALFLRGPAASRDEINWESLIPPENVTRWIAVDLDRKRIKLEPSRAIPDLT